MAESYSATLWRQIAEEARAVAARMKSEELRRELFQMAQGYDALARLADVRADRHPGGDEAPTG
jgi:hypothetical protein